MVERKVARDGADTSRRGRTPAGRCRDTRRPCPRRPARWRRGASRGQRARDPDLERRAHETRTPMPGACTAPYATGRCPSSSHSISLVGWGLSTRSGPSGTPATPSRRSTRACRRRPAGPCSRPCARPGSSAATASSMRSKTGCPSQDGDALVVDDLGDVRSAQGRGADRTTPWSRRPGRPRSAWASTPDAIRGWPASPSPTSAGSRSSRVPSSPVRPSSSCPASRPKRSRRWAGPGAATHVSLVATALRRIDASVFSCVLLGGSQAPDVLPPNVVATYGMTETGSGVVYDGWPLEGVEVALRHEDGSFCRPRPDASASPEGEILVRAPMLFRCYRDGSDGRVSGPGGEASWFATGDAGRWDVDGRLVVSGRLDEVITTGAEKVWPDLVERVAERAPRRGRGRGLEAVGPRVGRARGGLDRADRGRPVTGRAAPGGGRHHRAVGRPQGARDRRRPARAPPRARCVASDALS